MNISIIVQARMSSSRLPGKVLKNLNGITLLECLLKQLNYCQTIDNIFVATTTEKIDNEIVNKCEELKILGTILKNTILDVRGERRVSKNLTFFTFK